MNTGKRVFISILIGWLITGLLLFIGFNKLEMGRLPAILLWNVALFVALAGNGPLLGYNSQGNPMYEGTPVHMVFGFIGVLSGFIIYPIIAFLIISLFIKVRDKNMQYKNNFHQKEK